MEIVHGKIVAWHSDSSNGMITSDDGTNYYLDNAGVGFDYIPFVESPLTLVQFNIQKIKDGVQKSIIGLPEMLFEAINVKPTIKLTKKIDGLFCSHVDFKEKRGVLTTHGTNCYFDSQIFTVKMYEHMYVGALVNGMIENIIPTYIKFNELKLRFTFKVTDFYL